MYISAPAVPGQKCSCLSFLIRALFGEILRLRCAPLRMTKGGVRSAQDDKGGVHSAQDDKGGVRSAQDDKGGVHSAQDDKGGVRSA